MTYLRLTRHLWSRFFVLSLLATFVLAGCGKPEDKSAETKGQSNTSDAAKTKDASNPDPKSDPKSKEASGGETKEPVAVVMKSKRESTEDPNPNPKPKPTTTTPAKSRGTIGVSLLTLDNPFFKVIGDNIEAEGAKRGYKVIVVSGDKDVAKQGNQIKDFIVKGVAAIVLSPCDSKSIIPIIQEANQAGIPVFTVDIPCNEPGVKIVTQIATDNFGGGREAGTAMIEALGEAGGAVAILHFKQAESCQLRVKGFMEVIEAHNASGKSKIEIVTELESGGASDQGYRATEDAMQAHPEIRGIFAINDPAALGARAALEAAAKADQVKIVGFDGQPEGKQAIKDGKIYADPIQFPDQMGIQIVDAIVRHSKGDELPPQMLIPTKLYRLEDAKKDPELK